MINLLPPFARKHVLIAYWTRVAALALFAWTLAIVMVVLIHLTVYLELTTNINHMQQSVGEAERLHAFTAAASDDITTANQKARLLLEESDYASFTTYLSAMEELAGTSISIDEMQLRRDEEVVSPLSLSAVAATRQDLIAFIDAVQSHPSFGEVDIPISNLAQSQNISFSVQVPIRPTAGDDS